MTSFAIGIFSLIALLVLIWAGMHVAITMALVSFLGVWAIKGKFVVASKLFALAAYDTIASHIFGVVPLFVLMGLLVSVSDVGADTFRAANRLFGRLRGGLGIATVAANAVFAAITGISIASAAVFTKVAVPEMLKLNYSPRFAVGVVAGSSVLGMLIPPSLLLILYGFLSEVSIGALFVAGIVPGLLLAVCFALAILVMAYRFPAFVGGNTESGGQEGSLWKVATDLLPIVLLILLVLGGIYGGFFTPTEAGAVGAAGALVIALIKRKLTWRGFWGVLMETGHVVVAICFLIIAASLYSRMLALTGLPQFLLTEVEAAELGATAVIGLTVLLILLLGTVMDSTSIMLITLPLILPVLSNLGVDLVWFGIVVVVAVEVGLLTPPLGLSVYVIKSTLDDDRISLVDIFAGSAPFALIMCIVLGALLLFPQIALVLL